MERSHSLGYFLCAMLAVVTIVVIPSGCSSGSGDASLGGIDITGMSLSQSTCTLAVNADIQLTATVTPADATNAALTWSSSDPAIATVTSAGLVHGAAAGSATITAEAASFSATCVVTVVENLVSVTSISVSPNALNLTHPASSQLVATVLPANATDKTVSYSSSNPAVVTMDEMGMITTVGAGTAIVTARTTNGGFTDTCSVTVSLPNIAVTGINLAPPHLSLVHPASAQLVAQTLPANATDTSVSFASSDPSIATVNASGVVSSVAAGNAVITATTHDGAITATATVTVSLSLVPVTSISLNHSSLALTHPDTSQLVAAVLPLNATDATVTFASSDPLVATVDSSGMVTTTGGGTTTITATASDGIHTAQCLVTVTSPVTSVSLVPSTLSLVHPSSEQLIATIEPPGATNKTVSFTSSNPAIATVNSSGLVSTVSAGTAVITVASSDGNFSASCELIVTLAAVPVASVSLDRASLELAHPANAYLVATVLPAIATNKEVVFSSSDAAVATVNGTGHVISVGSGSANITVTTADGGFTDTCSVTVTMPVIGVSLAPDSVNLVHPATQLLVATVTPANASNRTVSYSSSDPAVATVSALGMVTTVGSGTTDITVTTADGNFTDTCSVIVTIPVTGVSLAPDSVNLVHPATQILVATVTPAHASNWTVSYSSSDPAVATVSALGLVTTVGSGVATITVTTQDGSLTANCVVTVTVPVESVTLNPHALTLAHPGTGQLGAAVVPASASNTMVSYSSSDIGVATVSNSGLVTSVGPGSATITVTTADGSFSDQCSVTVTIPVMSVSLDQDSLTLAYPSTTQLVATVLPATASNEAVNYSSSDICVVSVSSTGLVTTEGAGNAVITVTTVDGGYADSCQFKVGYLTLMPASMLVHTAATGQFNAVVQPVDTANQAVSWTSSAPSIATVSSSGLVTGVATGTATIRATSIEGGFTRTSTVTVSIPGDTWRTSSILSSPNAWTGLAFGNNAFVAIAQGGRVAATSIDALAWTAASLPKISAWKCIAFGNILPSGTGIFVALSKSGDCATSPDGSTWTTQTAASASLWTSVAFGGGRFVAIAENGPSMFSTDGVTWTAGGSLPETIVTWKSITYGNGLFVVVAGGNYPSNAHSAYSTDGQTWTAANIDNSKQWQSVVFGKGLFVAVGSASERATSANGTTWTLRSITYGNNLAGFGNGYFFTPVDAADLFGRSSDGSNWGWIRPPVAKYWSGIVYGNGKLVLVGTNSATVLVSP